MDFQDNTGTDEVIERDSSRRFDYSDGGTVSNGCLLQPTNLEYCRSDYAPNLRCKNANGYSRDEQGTDNFAFDVSEPEPGP